MNNEQLHNLIYSLISLFESRDIVTRLFNEKHNRELSASKAIEIVSSIAQAREYFSAANTAGILVRPLLLYYGVLSFSKGAILFLSPQLREAGLAGSHGLTTTGWRESLSKGIQNIASLKIKCCKGTFLQLYESTNNSEQFTVDLSPYPNKVPINGWDSSTSINGLTITVEQIIGRLPDLYDLFEKTFNKASSCYSASIFISAGSTNTKPRADISIINGKFGLPNETQFKAMFSLNPETNFINGSIKNEPTIGYTIEATTLDELISLLPEIKNNKSNQAFLVPKINNDINLSTMNSLFIMSYAMGMLVRYYPTDWLSLVNRQKGDFMFPLIQDSMNFIQERFPELALSYIE